MRKNDDKKNPARSVWASALTGIGIGFLLAFILLALLSALIAGGKISEEGMRVLTVAAAYIGATIGSLIAIKRRKVNILPLGFAVGGAMFLVTLIGSAFNENARVFGGLSLPLLAAYLAGGLSGVGLNLRKKGRRRA
jgi:putative membrane protein (TIGR04086 family)